MVKVSVIIPTYNVEEFLGECLECIVNQTLKDIEIICINDGSTAKSLVILNDYASNDNRIKVISQENKGHAAASNKGMDLSTGEYLYLMDSDDLLELNALEETYNYAEKKSADFVLFQSMNYSQDENKVYKSWIYSMDEVADFIGDSVVDYKDLGDLIFKIPVTPWSKLYNNNFIKEIGVRFPEGLIFDDNIFFWDVLFNAKRIAFYKKYLFTRRWYDYSSTMAGDLRFIDSIAINNLMIDRFKKYGAFDVFKETLYNRKIDLNYLRFVKINSEFKKEYFDALQEDYFKIIRDGDYEDYMSVLNSRNKHILNSCLEAKTCKEFKYERAYWDAQFELMGKKSEVDALKSENKILKNDYSKLNNEYDDVKKDLNKFKNENTKLKNEVSSYKSKNKKLDDSVKSLNRRNTILHKEISEYKSSNSWKITKPLRVIKRKL